MNAFFRNNFIKGVGLFLLFGIFNILIIVGLIFIFGTFNQNIDYYNRINFKDITESLNGDEALKQEVRSKLEEQNSFYMIIDPDGNIENSEFLPAELNHSYTRADIASFSRWYLDDYPVNTRILDNGSILVVGFPKNSLVKHSFTYTIQSFFQTVFLFPIVLILNFVLFILLFWRQQKKAQFEVEPIINGIDDLAAGKEVELKESGPLKNVKSELNKASNLLLEREKGRADWISGVSHDLRTPLSAILTASELIENSNENKVYVEQIQRNVTKLGKLAQNLNLSNKLQHGLAPVKKEELNIAELLRNNIINFIDENSIDPELIELKAVDSILKIDPFLFERLIQNLLDNWFSHNQEGTKLKIICHENINVYTLNVENKINRENLNNTEKHYGIGLELINQICILQDWGVKITEDEKFQVMISIPAED